MQAAAIRDGWIDGLVHLPGRNAGYRAGRIRLRTPIRHETVGTNSRQIGINGYFQFLLPKEGPAEQYCEWDAIAWHACEWNLWGFGLECERFPGEPMTANQVWWAAYIILAVQEHTGQALTLDWIDYAIPNPASGPVGYANHGALLIRACDPHSDGWTFDEWQQIIRTIGGATPPTSMKGTDQMDAIYGVDPADPDWGNAKSMLCIVKSGDLIISEMSGPPLPPEYGGLPNHPDIGSWLNGGGEGGQPGGNGRGVIPVRLVHPFVLIAARLAHENALVKPPTAAEIAAAVIAAGGGGGGGGGTGPTVAQLAAVANAEDTLNAIAGKSTEWTDAATAAAQGLDREF